LKSKQRDQGVKKISGRAKDRRVKKRLPKGKLRTSQRKGFRLGKNPEISSKRQTEEGFSQRGEMRVGGKRRNTGTG